MIIRKTKKIDIEDTKSNIQPPLLSLNSFSSLSESFLEHKTAIIPTTGCRPNKKALIKPILRVLPHLPIINARRYQPSIIKKKMKVIPIKSP